MSGYNFYIFLSEDLFTFTNSADPDEMQHYAAFHLVLLCLQKYLLLGFLNTKGLILLNIKITIIMEETYITVVLNK